MNELPRPQWKPGAPGRNELSPDGSPLCNPMNHPDEQPTGASEPLRFDRLLVLIAVMILFILALALALEAVFS